MRADIVMLTKDDELAAKAVSSVAEFCDMSKIGRLVIGWTGEPCSAGLYMLLKLANGLDFDVRVEQMDYNFARCNNALVAKHCSSEAVLFMNDDVELSCDAVSRCLETLEDPKVGTVGIKLLFPDGTIQHAGVFVSAPWGVWRGVGHALYRQPDRQLPPSVVDGNTGAFMAVRRALFDELGGFNESYRMCFEDVELNMKATAAGYRNVCRLDAYAVHAESATRKQAMCEEDAARMIAFWEANLRKKPVGFAVCAIASPLEKNYLGEWVEYHRRIGVEKFFVATNDWTWEDPPECVEAVRVDGRAKQTPWYTWFARNKAGEADWVAFIDCDEFIRLGAGQKSVLDLVKGREGQDALALSWRMFGSSGKRFDGDYSVLKRFTMRQKGFNPHVKTVLNAKRLRENGSAAAVLFSNPHSASLDRPELGASLDSRSVDGRRVPGPLDHEAGRFLDDDSPYLAHFFVKTPEEWKRKRERGRIDVPEGSKLMFRKDEEFAENDLNEAEDTSLRGIIEREGPEKV